MGMIGVLGTSFVVITSSSSCIFNYLSFHLFFSIVGFVLLVFDV